jgi:hypothetical protein
MKGRIVTIAIGLSLAISAARGTPILHLFEANENLHALFNGGPPSFVTITQTSPDHWKIEFSQGWTLDVGPAGFFDEEIGEPEGGFDPNGLRLENFIRFADETTILWVSENPNFVGLLPISVVEPGVLFSPSLERFDIRLADVPEPSFTITIFGIGLAGLAWFARFRRTAM